MEEEKRWKKMQRLKPSPACRDGRYNDIYKTYPSDTESTTPSPPPQKNLPLVVVVIGVVVGIAHAYGEARMAKKV